MSEVGTPLIHVACGVLRRADGRVLLAQRPEGKIAAGWWEFPGGKLEPGETGAAALSRELEEELGVVVQGARPLIRFEHDYGDRRVQLEAWLIDTFAGEPRGLEAQAFDWVEVGALLDWPQALPTVAPIAKVLCLPVLYAITPPDASGAFVMDGLAQLPAHSLLRLRSPQLSDAEYVALARRVIRVATDMTIEVVLDRDAAMAAELGAAGWHASASVLQRLAEIPVAPRRTFASCHDLSEIARARELGVDAIVLGPVQATASHPGQKALGWHAFSQLQATAGLPVFAIGGLGPESLEVAQEHWAHGVAGISAFWR